LPRHDFHEVNNIVMTTDSDCLSCLEYVQFRKKATQTSFFAKNVQGKSKTNV